MRIITRNQVDHLIWRFGQGNTAEIFDIVVYTERNKGVGTSMVKQAISELRKFKVRRLFAFTRKENHSAHGFYEKLGFVGTDVPNFYPDGDAKIYVKEI